MGPTSVKEDPGDDSVILRAVLRWTDAVEDVLKAPFGDPSRGRFRRREDGPWEIIFSVDRNPTRRSRQRHFLAVDVGPLRRHPHAVVQIDDHTWDVTPSVVFPGQIHAFVTLTGVPEEISKQLHAEADAGLAHLKMERGIE